MDNQQKDKTLDLAIGQIEKEFGKGAIMRMGDGNKVKGKSFVKREPVTDELWQKHLDGVLFCQ